MKKAILAATVGLALIGSQALAQGTATARVSDRVGAQAGESEEFAGMSVGLIFAAATVLAFVTLNEASDDGDSD